MNFSVNGDDLLLTVMFVIGFDLETPILDLDLEVKSLGSALTLVLHWNLTVGSELCLIAMVSVYYSLNCNLEHLCLMYRQL